ncbi:MAG TPA: hotdog domain-containing protein [Lentimicrobium sp.]|nr:hotdog domain-containing protein [Lentimicrobium sp.]
MERNTTIITRLVMPGMLNDQSTLFGGNLLKWMDEAAYIAAVRSLNRRLVTVSVEKVRFLKPCFQGEVVEVVARVVSHTRVLLGVEVVVHKENVSCGVQIKAAKARFLLAAVNDDFVPQRLDE